jgi:hypothetical protein
MQSEHRKEMDWLHILPTTAISRRGRNLVITAYAYKTQLLRVPSEDQTI